MLEADAAEDVHLTGVDAGLRSPQGNFSLRCVPNIISPHARIYPLLDAMMIVRGKDNI